MQALIYIVVPEKVFRWNGGCSFPLRSFCLDTYVDEYMFINTILYKNTLPTWDAAWLLATL